MCISSESFSAHALQQFRKRWIAAKVRRQRELALRRSIPIEDSNLPVDEPIEHDDAAVLRDGEVVRRVRRIEGAGRSSFLVVANDAAIHLIEHE